MNRHHTHLSDIPGNLIDVVKGLVRMPRAMFVTGVALTNKLIADPSPSACDECCGQPHIEHCRDGSIVRHHYSTCCVPRSYRCGGRCT